MINETEATQKELLSFITATKTRKPFGVPIQTAQTHYSKDLFIQITFFANKCTIVCFNVTISSVNSIYMRISLYAYAMYTNSFMCMYYNVLPNKLTLTHNTAFYFYYIN